MYTKGHKLVSHDSDDVLFRSVKYTNDITTNTTDANHHNNIE
jgi:hypothetical protein